MLPLYTKKDITADRITQDIMAEALEREDVAVSVDTARRTCLLVDQLERNMKQFEKELLSDPYFKDYSASEMVNFLARDIADILYDKESADYKKAHLSGERTTAAMQQAGIIVDVDLMESMLATYAIGGKELLEQEWLPHLQENKLTTDNIASVANCY